MKHIDYIGFHRTAGLLEQKAQANRNAQKSYESMAGSIWLSNIIVAELVQVRWIIALPEMFILIRGSVKMFGHGIIRHKLNRSWSSGTTPFWT